MGENEYVPMAVEIPVSNFQKSLIFYRDVLGFRLLRINEEEWFAPFEFNGAILMITQVDNGTLPNFNGNSTIIRFILKEGIQSYFEQVKSSGAPILKPLETMPYGLTRFYVTDPDGYKIKFAQNKTGGIRTG